MTYHPGMTKKGKGCLLALLAAVMLVGLAVAAPRAEATTLYRCPSVTPAYTCTQINNTVTVYDRVDGVNVTWQANTSVGLGYYSWDFDQHCGTHGDGYVWSVAWYAGGHGHWAVIGDWWLRTGTPSEWGSHVADPYGNTFDPTYYLSPHNGPQGYCNSSYWGFMNGRI